MTNNPTPPSVDAELRKLLTQLRKVQESYDNNRLGWKVDDGSAEQDLSTRVAKIEQAIMQLLTQARKESQPVEVRAEVIANMAEVSHLPKGSLYLEAIADWHLSELAQARKGYVPRPKVKARGVLDDPEYVYTQADVDQKVAAALMSDSLKQTILDHSCAAIGCFHDFDEKAWQRFFDTLTNPHTPPQVDKEPKT